MKKEQLFKAAGDVDDELLVRSEKNSKHRAVPIKWGTLAACLAFAVLAVMIINTKYQSSKLPTLTITQENKSYGYEGYWAYDILEIVNSNPWTEDMNITVLPVYENTISYDGNYQDPRANIDEMKDFLTEIAGRMGFDTQKLVITDEKPEKEQKKKIVEKPGGNVPEDFFSVTGVFAERGNIKLEVNGDMTAIINFEPPVTLPDKYTFSNTPEICPTHNNMRALAEYLQKEYKDLIAMQNAEINIFGGYYTTEKQQIFNISFFEAAADNVSQIINYNFNNVTFACDEDGKLFLAKVYRHDLSHKVGDYPIITADKAKELLKNGNYITSVPNEYLTLPIASYVSKVELIYKSGISNQYFMPFYHFLVELPKNESENGMKEYGSFYVPAVDERYISNMPLEKLNLLQ